MIGANRYFFKGAKRRVSIEPGAMHTPIFGGWIGEVRVLTEGGVGVRDCERVTENSSGECVWEGGRWYEIEVQSLNWMDTGQGFKA